MKTKDIYKGGLLGLMTCIFLFSACKKNIEVELAKNLIDAEFVFTDNTTATAAITGIYYEFIKSGLLSGGAGRLSAATGLASDELYEDVPSELGAPFQNNMNDARNATVLSWWGALYKAIYQANVAIEGLEKASELTPAVKSQLEGEAYLMRGLSHFYLVNLFGDIPLILNTDYRASGFSTKTKSDAIYDRIVADLIEAQQRLAENYINEEKFRPNKAVATAFLARVYLYAGEWEKASKEASYIINSPSYELLTDLDQVFLKNSKEMIWQFGATNPNFNTDEVYFNIESAPTTGIVVLRDEFVESFEEGDNRRQKWIGTFISTTGSWNFVSKYKRSAQNEASNQYFSVLRLSEQYLISAEAKIQLGNVAGGISDLNILRMNRRISPASNVPNPLPNISSLLSKQEALLAVENERRHELFVEWGQRWFDLKRTDRINTVLGALKGSNWQPTDILFPIPQDEIDKNPNLK
ncbi:MAG: RagB/SusD family nutrient uptake outer membrane protein [Flavobacterium sp.]|nr:MAG: RagB/SusD family nutrient uptake outer membrane protein [Flavobacterium sp.]